MLNWQRFCEAVIELYYQEVWLVLDNIYMRICLADCPEFKALSYCWGNFEDTETLRVVFQEGRNIDSSFQIWHIHKFNRDVESLIKDTYQTDINTSRTAHANFAITPNLHAALISFRRSDEIGFIWADMLCINQGDDKERSGQVGIMKSIYEIADSVSVWLGNDVESETAIFAEDNYALVLFKLALEDAGWGHHGDRRLGKFLTQNYPQRVARGEASHHFLTGTLQSSAFVEFLSGNRSRMKPVSDQEVSSRVGQKRKHDVEIDETFSESTQSFLDWLHEPYLQHLAKDPFGLYLPFYKYRDRITDTRSDVWQWIEFEIAALLRTILPGRLLQTPQNIIQRFSIISSNPWFRRVWVLQEVANNAKVHIRVGTDEASWAIF